MDRNRLLTIFGAAWLSAALLTWFLYANTKAPKTEKTVRVVVANKELQAGSRLRQEDLKLIDVFEKSVPAAAMTSTNEALGRTLIYPVMANEPITASRLSTLTGAEGAAAVIQPGKRAISVPFTDASGAAGLLQPKSHVDVLFTRTGNAVEAMTVTVLEDLEVLSVGRQLQVDSSQKGPATGSGQQRTATLLVTPEQAQKLELAKNQGKLSLSLRNPLDRSTQANLNPTGMEDLDPELIARAGGKRPAKIPANVRDRKAWANLIGEEPKPPAPKPPPEKKEPPKPRAVVDVFRGEKHVQEIFQ